MSRNYDFTYVKGELRKDHFEVLGIGNYIIEITVKQWDSIMGYWHRTSNWSFIPLEYIEGFRIV